MEAVGDVVVVMVAILLVRLDDDVCLNSVPRSTPLHRPWRASPIFAPHLVRPFLVARVHRRSPRQKPGERMGAEEFYEGTEKLLEVWFSRDDGQSAGCDLRKIPR